ncbi:hypothetical protein EDD21DRAFT_366692 [Dissophora ornata]|nr:hypothetical protein EDD21DRAFT_366692 [Dissophora ornata]
MRFSTAATLVALSSLALLATSPSLVSARLTSVERLEVEAKDPSNPNYCPACLQKAMHNHFPHACSKDLESIEATSRPEGPRPDEQRCVCISFLDLYWMKLDCEQECAFVNDPEAMSHFLSADSIPGCDQWIDFETGKEKEVEGFEKKDLSHQPEVFPLEEETEGATENTEEEQEEDVKVADEPPRAEDVKQEEDTEATQVTPEEPKVAKVDEEDLKVQKEAKADEARDEL